MSSTAASVKYISECFIKPKQQLKQHSNLINLTTWDIAMLSVRYMQYGLLYHLQPESYQVSRSLLDQLKESLSITLLHFYPLAGQLETQQSDEENKILIFINPTKGPGAKFIHAAVDLRISDLLSPTDVPSIVDSFFDPYRAVNHDGHHLPLLTIQVTQLLDGIFIGCSMNHTSADGTSYWHFFNSWSEIFMKKLSSNGDHAEVIDISRPPIHTRWSIDGSDPVVKLPFAHAHEFIRRYNNQPPPLRNRIFHFSSESIRRIKSRANTTNCSTTTVISSLQALSALVWRCVTRARRCRVPTDGEVACFLLINNRSRLNPSLSENYFGNCIQVVQARTTAGELLGQSFRWTALMLNEAVSSHNDKVVRDTVLRGMRNPFIVYETESVAGGMDVVMVGSPWFDLYVNEFGMGEPVAALSGDNSKIDGKMIVRPGRLGNRSVDLEICLVPDTMSALEADEEFMAIVG